MTSLLFGYVLVKTHVLLVIEFYLLVVSVSTWVSVLDPYLLGAMVMVMLLSSSLG